MATCNDCDAEILWVHTTTGGRMPLNVGRVPGGNVEIRDGVAHVVKGDPLTPRHVCHHATCPVEQKVRRAQEAARKAEKERIAKKQLGLFGGPK